MSQAANGPKTLFNTLLTDISNEDLEGVGTIRQEGDKFYRWVKNNSGQALVVGQSVCYDIDGAEAYHEIVYTPASADLHALAGIAISAIADYTGVDTIKCYGWIQIEGYNAAIQVLQSSDTAHAVGDLYLAVNTKSYASRYGALSAGLTYASNATAHAPLLGYMVAAAVVATVGTHSFTSNTAGWIHCLNV